MGRQPCCGGDGDEVKKGPWTPEEDRLLADFIAEHGCGKWRHIPKLAGLNRCGKSCRLRWTNYLRPDIKRGRFSPDDDKLIIHLHSILGNKWSAIAAKLPGRTDNEIKNYWNTHLRKKLLGMGIDPVTHRPRTDLTLLAGFQSALAATNLSSLAKLQADAANMARIHLMQGLMQVLAGAPPVPPLVTTTASSSEALSTLLATSATALLMNQQQQELAAGFMAPGSVPNLVGGITGQENGSAGFFMSGAPAAESTAEASSGSSSSQQAASLGGLEKLILDDLDDPNGDYDWKHLLEEMAWMK